LTEEARFDKYLLQGAYHWDAAGSSIRRHNIITAARYLQVLRLAGSLEGQDVLDIGCGDGKLIAMLGGAGARRVLGVDYETRGLVVGRERMERELSADVYAKIRLARGDGFRLPVRSHEWDLAVVTDLIEHVEEPSLLVREAARVLRGSGTMIVTTPYRATEVPLEKHHVHEFFPGELKTLIEEFFTEVEIVLSDPLWLVELYTMGGLAKPLRLALNCLAVWGKVNPMLAVPVRRYAGQITAIARSSRLASSTISL
jgi:SAM-dependent methyltransferase